MAKKPTEGPAKTHQRTVICSLEVRWGETNNERWIVPRDADRVPGSVDPIEIVFDEPLRATIRYADRETKLNLTVARRFTTQTRIEDV